MPPPPGGFRSSQVCSPQRIESTSRCSTDVGRGSLLPDGGDGGFERRIEAVTIERLEEAVATDEILESGPHLSESHMDARGVELTVELLEHSRCRHIDIGHRLALDDDPHGMALGDEHGGSGSGRLRQFAKNSGASQR